MRGLLTLVIGLAAATVLGLGPARAAEEPAWPVVSPKLSSAQAAAFRQAMEYSRSIRELSMLVIKDGEVVFEDYAHGHAPNKAYNLFSGTKSFNGVIAVAAVEDGLLTSLDERVSDTITEWRADPQRKDITIRQLLSLVSGIEAGTQGSIPTYAQAIKKPMLHKPGEAFAYGPVPFQVFGELMRRKLAPSGETIQAYLKRRVMTPIGMRMAMWARGDDGNVRMSAGMSLTAREWAKFGQLILNKGRWGEKQVLDPGLLAQCFKSSDVNPIYGLTFWLPYKSGGLNDHGNPNRNSNMLAALGAPEIIKAAGVGGQKQYIIPELNMTIVRQSIRRGKTRAEDEAFADYPFLAPILKAHGYGQKVKPQ